MVRLFTGLCSCWIQIKVLVLPVLTIFDGHWKAPELYPNCLLSNIRINIIFQNFFLQIHRMINSCYFFHLVKQIKRHFLIFNSILLTSFFFYPGTRMEFQLAVVAAWEWSRRMTSLFSSLMKFMIKTRENLPVKFLIHWEPRKPLVACCYRVSDHQCPW